MSAITLTAPRPNTILKAKSGDHSILIIGRVNGNYLHKMGGEDMVVSSRLEELDEYYTA